MGTVGVGEANDTIMGGVRFAKNTFLFLRVHELDIILGVNTDRKNRVEKMCSPKK